MSKEVENLTNHIEIQKVVMGYIKHLTALSTGSIILLTILLEKFFNKDILDLRFLIGTSFISFLLSVLLFSLCSLGIIKSMRVKDANSLENKKYSSITFFIGIITFFLGLVSLSIFAIVNWY